jgi:glycosyltransferase involved in cell wall biosynthesis
MTIGVDAGALSISDKRLKVGVWRVTFELLKHLSVIDTANEYRMYSFAPIEKKIMMEMGKSMENIVLSPSVGYMKFRLPLELMQRPVDIFLGLSQALPPNISVKTIGCVYDLAFLHMGKSYGISFNRLKKQTEDVVRRSDHLVTISQFSKKDIMKFYGVPREKISVCYPGVTRMISLSTKSPHTVPYILFVGALKPAKQIPLAIKGFKAFLSQTKRRYDFLLVGGDYWMDPEIRSTIESLHLTERVHIVGHVSDDRLPAYYSHASTFLTLGSWEGFCMPAVEAMAYGCPVVYAQTGATPEIVGDAGIPVNPLDQDEIGRALHKMTTHASFGSSCIQKGKKRASQFTWKRFGKQWLEIINKI